MATQCPNCHLVLTDSDSAAATPRVCPQCKGNVVPIGAVKSGDPIPIQLAAHGVPEMREESEVIDAASIYVGNPETNPFVGATELDERKLHEGSTHEFHFGQFCHRHSAPQITTALGLIGLVGLSIAVAVRGIPKWEDSGVILFLIIVACSTCLVCGGLGFFAWRFITCPRLVIVDHLGFTWSGFTGRHKVDWPSVASVWRTDDVLVNKSGAVVDWQSNVTVKADNGTMVSFNHSLSGYKELAAKIQYFGFPHLLAKKQADLAMGKADFGGIVLLPERIVVELGLWDVLAFFQNNIVLWDHLLQWGVYNGNLILCDSSKIYTIPLCIISDLKVLFALLEKISGRKVASETELERLSGITIPR